MNEIKWYEMKPNIQILSTEKSYFQLHETLVTLIFELCLENLVDDT
jgi:hypothetical protein